MRVLLIADYAASHIGAFGSSVIALASHLRDSGDEIRFAFPDTSPLAAELGRTHRTSLGDSPGAGRWKESLWRAVAGLTEDWNPDVIHVNFGQASLLAGLRAARRTGAALIWHVRSFPRQRRGPGRLAATAWYRMVSGRIDRAVCTSGAVASDLASRGYVPRDRIEVIYNGVPGPERLPVAGDDRLRSTLETLGMDRAAGMVANFGPEKDHATLIRAFSGVRRSCPSAGLVLVGEEMRGDGGTGGSTVRQLVRDEGLGDSVVLAGRIDPVWSALALLSCGVLVSRTEGFGNAAAEYGLMGLPAVVSRTGGLPEVVEDGVTGFVVPEGDADALGSRLTRLLQDPALAVEMGARGRLRVSALFSVDAWVRRMDDLFRRTAGDA